MKRNNLILFAVLVLLMFSCRKAVKVSPAPAPAKQSMPAMTIRGKEFYDTNGKRFIPWGLQYTNTAKIPLLEDNWFADTTWAVILQDFQNMKALGANIIRIHLEYNKFMLSSTLPNQEELNRLKQLVDYAEQIGEYLDVTGLACYRASDTPAWYNAMNEQQRWATQCVFWEAIAKTIGGNNNVMDYDLMNEPVAPASVTNTWLPGAPFGGYNFVQNITENPAGRSTDSIFKAWTAQLSAAIRKYDKKTLITVGFLPLGNIADCGTNLNYISTHVYPTTGQIPQEVSFVNTNNQQTAEPLVIEEFYDLYADHADMVSFMEQTRDNVSGYLSYYDGNGPQELLECHTTTIGCAIQYDWMQFYFSVGVDPNK
jgi:hypothetical protein